MGETALLDLPGEVIDEICTILDSSTEHNWMKLVGYVPNYTHGDIIQLRNLAQQGFSPSRELLKELNGQGWTIMKLAEAAKKAGIMSIIDVFSTYCLDEGIEFDLTHDTSTGERHWIGAKSCFHRSQYPTEVDPPSYTEEVYKRYKMPHPPAPAPEDNINVNEDGQTSSIDPTGSSEITNGGFGGEFTPLELSSQSITHWTTSTVVSIPFEASPPPVGLEEVKYEVLKDATGQFDSTPYREGGHKVGEGGFGEVFQCFLELQNGCIHAAVKVLLDKSVPSSPGMSTRSMDSVDRQQFSTEIQSLSKLSHECLLPVLAYSCNGPHLCLVYPFMSNGSLEAHLPDQTTLPPLARLRVACDVASALHYLHSLTERTIIHRDVKSANILLSEDWRGRLGDFGLARALLPSSQHSSVLTSTIVGTSLYMSPEAVNGTISPAADVYAFGVVLLELLTGRCALTGVKTESGEDTDMLSYILDYEGEEGELIVGTWEKDLSQEVWSLAMQCISHFRKKRPSSTEIFHKLHSFLPS